MIEQIKESIWGVLSGKEISLAMIFDDQGKILWHRGRAISPTDKLGKGCGYCTTPIQESLALRKRFLHQHCTAVYTADHQTESSRVLNIKSLLILPLGEHLFLYLDSGVKEGFSDSDVAVFESAGTLLSEMILKMYQGKSDRTDISGSSPQIQGVRELLARYAIEEEPVLLLGETGVGKSHLAELIHRYSGRKGRFVVVNTPGMPDTLIESQFFGHRKGAFSGAASDADGFVAIAEKGTLFLDEIAELDTGLQAKFLRFIETGRYNRLGDPLERQADVRLIAATNRDIKAMIAEKTFREDLFFRLHGLTITIPPLRERRQDIIDLIDSRRGVLRGKNLTAEAMKILLDYAWPGNVRELIQTLKVVGIRHEGSEIGAEITSLLAFHEASTAKETDKIGRIYQELSGGASFWTAVKDPFLGRDLNRQEVMAILARGLEESNGKYSALLPLFNLAPTEYKNFMRFIYENKLK